MKQVQKILLLVFLSGVLSAFSQGGTQITRIPRNYKVFQVGGIGSLDMCFRTYENTTGDASINTLIGSRNNSETFKFGYHAGIGFCINATEHFGMETGIIYGNQGYETKLQDFIYIQPDPTAPEKGRSIYNYNFLEVPLKANFFFGKGKVRFYGSIGVIANILVAQNETFVEKYHDGRTEYEVFQTNYPFEKVTFSGTIAAGIDWKFNKFISLRLAPHFSHGTGRFMDSQISMYLWNTGFTAGLYYGWW